MSRYKQVTRTWTWKDRALWTIPVVVVYLVADYVLGGPHGLSRPQYIYLALAVGLANILGYIEQDIRRDRLQDIDTWTKSYRQKNR